MADSKHDHEQQRPDATPLRRGRYRKLSALPRAILDGSHSAAVPPTSEAPMSLPPIERIERALVLLAYFIELDGDVHVPLFEKLEAELKALRHADDTKTRAKQLLEAYSRSGGLRAICSKNLSLSSSDGPLPYLGLWVL